MNIVTGIFVSDALEVATMDKDLVEQAEKKKAQSSYKALRKLFRKIATAGTISKADLEHHMSRPDVRAVMTTVGIEVNDIGQLFEFLDLDENGDLSEEEFVIGCMHVK